MKYFICLHMTISIEKSIEQEKDTTKPERRQSTYKINPLILNRGSPRSMAGEELDEDTIMSLFEAARWALRTITNHGDSYMLRETPCIGTNFLIC
jgi:hypothetical protein